MADDLKPKDEWDEFEVRVPRRLPLLLLYIFLAILVAILVVFGGRAIYRHYHNKSSTNVKTVPANTKELPKEPGSNKSNGTSGSTATNNSSNKNNINKSNNAALPNSGPGNIMAIFVGSTAIAGGVHYVVQKQRTKS